MTTKASHAEDEIRRVANELVSTGTPAADLGAAMIKAGAAITLQTIGPADTIEGLRQVAQQIADAFPADVRRRGELPN